jgi:hypothetical protein
LIASPQQGAAFTTALRAGAPAFISWAYHNRGPQDAEGVFYVDLVLDGILIERWYVEGLRAGWYVEQRDWSDLPKRVRLRPGVRTLQLVLDSTNLIPETDETDNVFTLPVLVDPDPSSTPPPPLLTPKLPDLIPFAPKGWDAPILAYSKEGEEVVRALSVDVPTFIRVAIKNAGLSSVQTEFWVHLFLDDVPVWRIRVQSIPAEYSISYEWDELQKVVRLTPGRHTLKLVVDATNLIDEVDEGNNVFVKEFIWGSGPLVKDPPPALPPPPAPGKPNLKPLVPPGWDGALVLRPDQGVFSPSLLPVGQAVYVHWAVKNAGTGDMERGYRVEVRLDGRPVLRWERPPLKAGEVDFVIDWSSGTPLVPSDAAPPEHLRIALVLDPDNQVEEAEEGDNTYEREVAVAASPPPRPPPTAYSPVEVQRKASRLLDLLLVRENTISPRGATYWADVMEVVDAAYFTLYGRALRDEPLFIHALSEAEYDLWVEIQCRDEARRSPADEQQAYLQRCLGLKNFDGFHTTWRGHSRIVMRGERPPADLIDTFAHELGHFRQAVTNPYRLPRRIILNERALQEAQAYAYTMLILRTLEDLLGRPLLLYPDLPRMVALIEWYLDRAVEEKDSKEHPRGQLLLWAALLTDGDLASLREELLRDKRLSRESTRKLFEHLVGIRWEMADEYVGRMLQSVEQHLPTIKALARGRLVRGLSYLEEGSPWLRFSGLQLP